MNHLAGKSLLKLIKMRKSKGDQTVEELLYYFVHNHHYIKILEYDWSSAALIGAVIVQLHTSCTCNCTVVRIMPE